MPTLLLHGRWRLAPLLLAPLAGFLGFLASAALLETAPPRRADAIVALTGREERMHRAFALLRAGLGERLLITGVVQGANRLELARVRETDPMLFDSTVDLDESAITTADNARVAAAWAQAHSFDLLLVVSSAWHLPRGLASLSREAPDASLAPAAASSPWPWRELPAEWAKFVWTRCAPCQQSSAAAAVR